MTERDDLLDMLTRINPVPEPGKIYEGGVDAARFHRAVQAKRGIMVHTTQSVHSPQPWFNRRGVLVAAAAFAIVLLLGVGGWMLIGSGGEEIGPVAADEAPLEEPPPVAVDETTTTANPETKGVPEETTTSTSSTTSTTTSTTSTSTTTSTTSTTTTSAPPPTNSLLGTPAPVPAGVDAEKPWLMGDGPGLCDDFWDYEGPAAVVPELMGYTGGEGPFFCLVGFDTSVPVEVVVTAPGMETCTCVLEPGTDIGDAVYAFVWRSFQGDPLGQYELEAFQGDGSATTSFDVIAPQKSGVIVEPIRARAGDPIDVFVFGHVPGATITVHVYHQTDAQMNAMYVNSTPVAIDAAGWGHVHIDSSSQDPPGIYQFLTDPESDMWVWAVPPYFQSVLMLSS